MTSKPSSRRRWATIILRLRGVAFAHGRLEQIGVRADEQVRDDTVSNDLRAIDQERHAPDAKA